MRGRLPSGVWGCVLALAAGLAAPILAPIPALGAASSAAGASGTWQIQKSPNVALPSGQINAMSCISADACAAVGYTRNASGIYVPLIETWNGTSWQRQKTPRPAGDPAPGLNGVSCVSADFCEAVGVSNETAGNGAVGFAERWNGTSWKLQAVPSPAGAAMVAPKAVSCASAGFCEAVGSYLNGSNGLQSLAEKWNGTTWRLQSSPNLAGSVPTQLDGVSCMSARFCQAVDFYGAMAETWNGTSWVARALPYPTGVTSVDLDAVSCTSTTFCEAVGTYPTSAGAQKIYAAVWTGKAWRLQSAPTPDAPDPVLDAVSCVSAAFCEAVGYHEVYVSGVDTFRATAEVWNGTTWRLQHATSRGGTALTILAGVSCASASACEAGGYLPAWIEAWDGGSWQTQRAVVPRAATPNVLLGASCVSAQFCVAVGSSAGAVPSPALAEMWDGAAWKTKPRAALSPLPQAVSCFSADFCEAVGATNSGYAAAGWNGTSWQSQPTPGTDYSAVSCASADFCLAVGGSGAALWNGTSWSAAALPSIPTPGGYTGVSCVSASACEAVGLSTATRSSYAAGWDGSSWTAQTVPSPAGASAAGLHQVSCTATSTAADFCEAVGAATGVGAFAAAWDGTAWTLQPVPVPAGASADALRGVSCTSADACVAVGGVYWPGVGQLTLAEAWDGVSWSVQPTPNPAPASDALNGVSCVPAGPCVAVGSAPDPGGYSATLVEASG